MSSLCKVIPFFIGLLGTLCLAISLVFFIDKLPVMPELVVLGIGFIGLKYYLRRRCV